MYVNKCIKCGREFETKNPKRVICPECLYPDKKMIVSPSVSDGESAVAPQNNESVQKEEAPKFYSSYSAGEGREVPQQREYNNNYGNRQNYNRNNYNRNQNNNRNNRGGYNNNNRQGGYSRDNNRQGGFNNRRPQGGGFNRNNNRFNNNRPQQRRPQRPKAPKQLLVSKEQLEQIELLYKPMLPLPNPDCHEVIGAKIGLEPRKVFFGINLVRQKMMLPKLPFPKRKLAITPDQLFAIKNLYEPLLPLPPIGCHKIIAAQLKMDEWRVHVGIGLIRSQMGLNRWNTERTDVPPELIEKNKQRIAQLAEENSEPAAEVEVAEKPKRGRKPKKEDADE